MKYNVLYTVKMNANKNVDTLSQEIEYLQIEMAELRRQVEIQDEKVGQLDTDVYLDISYDIDHLKHHLAILDEKVSQLAVSTETDVAELRREVDNRISRMETRFDFKMNQMTDLLKNHQSIIQKQRELIDVMCQEYGNASPRSAQNPTDCDTVREVHSLSERIERRNETVDFRIERLRQVMLQILGGIFNQTKQRRILKTHIGFLDFSDNEDSEDESSENVRREEEGPIMEDEIWPTTRQGDELEERVSRIEEMMKDCAARIQHSLVTG